MVDRIRVVRFDRQLHVLVPVPGTMIYVTPERVERLYGSVPDIDVNLLPPLQLAMWQDHWANRFSLTYHPRMTFASLVRNETVRVHLTRHASARPMLMVESARPVFEVEVDFVACLEKDGTWRFAAPSVSLAALAERDYPPDIKLQLAAGENERRRSFG